VTAVEALPEPQAVDAAVFVNVFERSLSVRLRDRAGGYERLLWTQAWQQLRRAQENGWPPGSAQPIYADLPGARRVVHGQPGEGGTLLFTFPPGTPGFARVDLQAGCGRDRDRGPFESAVLELSVLPPAGPAGCGGGEAVAGALGR
jgi:hypothetical protein